MELFPIQILSRAGHQTFAYTTTVYCICLRNSPCRVSVVIAVVSSVVSAVSFAAISVVASLAASVVGTGVSAVTISYTADIGAVVINARAVV